MITKEIPIDSGAINAHQSFSVSLNDEIFTFVMHYRTITKTWSLTILDEEDNLLFSGVRLVRGCNLLSNFFESEKFGGLMISGEEPTIDNIGISSNLIWFYDEQAQ